MPPGYHVRGTSTLRNATTGAAVLVWEKTAIDADSRLTAILDAVEGIADKLPREPVIPAPDSSGGAELLAVYPMGDPHLGMYAWEPEAGENFDLEIAERHLLGAVDRLVSLAPAAEAALILNLGDFFHADNASARTTRSHASLDVDGRWSKVLAVGVRVLCRVIERALERHARVTLRNEIGNHDDHTSIALSIALEHHYHDNPRVTVDTSPAKFWYYRFGDCLLATTHGDTCKLAQLPGIMAVDRREDWGQTEHRRWYTGHVHHESVKEFPGVVVETFRTLAPRDAWHAAQGYRSGRDMRLDIWHAKKGLINRHILGIGELR